MNWLHWGMVVGGAGLASSMTDWVFAGDWIHRRWTYPEAWRKGAETRGIIVSSALPFVTCGAFAWPACRFHIHAASGLFALAVLVWLIGPLPLILTNAAFLKLHRVFVGFYALGWWIKLAIIACALALFPL